MLSRTGFCITILFLFSEIAQARLKDVFFHYMVGSMTPSEAVQDVQQAQALGVDAFALNVGTNAPWSANATSCLFAAANQLGFKLFFSFDMTGWTAPQQFMPLLLQYISNPAYYQHNGLPFVSTFNGATLSFGTSSPNQGWQTYYTNALASAGYQSYFVPAFSDAPNGATNFFSTYPVVQGAMNWNSWPWESDGQVPVYTTVDLQYMSGAHAVGKTFMMGLSPLQFKHMDQYDNWYRVGTHNLGNRIPQVLQVQPDFLEIQTWNDAGESHYFGPIWPEAIVGTNIPAYTSGYDHSGWQQLVPALVNAYKNSGSTSGMVPTNGQQVQGAFWHHTMLQGSTCGSDSLGKPSGIENVQDVLTVALYAANANLNVRVSSGGAVLATYPATTGYNTWTVPGMTYGEQKVEVLQASGNVIANGTGPLNVVSDAPLCNYNYQVVSLTNFPSISNASMVQAVGANSTLSSAAASASISASNSSIPVYTTSSGSTSSSILGAAVSLVASATVTSLSSSLASTISPNSPTLSSSSSPLPFSSSLASSSSFTSSTSTSSSSITSLARSSTSSAISSLSSNPQLLWATSATTFSTSSTWTSSLSSAASSPTGISSPSILTLTVVSVSTTISIITTTQTLTATATSVSVSTTTQPASIITSASTATVTSPVTSVSTSVSTVSVVSISTITSVVTSTKSTTITSTSTKSVTITQSAKEATVTVTVTKKS